MARQNFGFSKNLIIPEAVIFSKSKVLFYIYISIYYGQRAHVKTTNLKILA